MKILFQQPVIKTLASGAAILPPPTSCRSFPLASNEVLIERSAHRAVAVILLLPRTKCSLSGSDPPTSSKAIVFPLPQKLLLFQVECKVFHKKSVGKLYTFAPPKTPLKKYPYNSIE